MRWLVLIRACAVFICNSLLISPVIANEALSSFNSLRGNEEKVSCAPSNFADVQSNYLLHEQVWMPINALRVAQNKKGIINLSSPVTAENYLSKLNLATYFRSKGNFTLAKNLLSESWKVIKLKYNVEASSRFTRASLAHDIKIILFEYSLLIYIASDEDIIRDIKGRIEEIEDFFKNYTNINFDLIDKKNDEDYQKIEFSQSMNLLFSYAYGAAFLGLNDSVSFDKYKDYQGEIDEEYINLSTIENYLCFELVTQYDILTKWILLERAGAENKKIKDIIKHLKSVIMVMDEKNLSKYFPTYYSQLNLIIYSAEKRLLSKKNLKYKKITYLQNKYLKGLINLNKIEERPIIWATIARELKSSWVMYMDSYAISSNCVSNEICLSAIIIEPEIYQYFLSEKALGLLPLD